MLNAVKSNIMTLRKEVEEKQKEVDGKQKEVNLTERVVAEKSSRIEEKSSIIAEKDVMIRRLQVSLTEGKEVENSKRLRNPLLHGDCLHNVGHATPIQSNPLQEVKHVLRHGVSSLVRDGSKKKGSPRSTLE